MISQKNIVCLGANVEPVIEHSLIKQRSEAWFEIRKQCLITGSTIHKAIGFDGLKNQKCFLQEKLGLKPPDSVSKELQSKFDHGAANETNAIATFVSSYLPAFHPNCSFYEEGCYIQKENGRQMLVVSPDGSIRDRKNENHLQFAIEIKCPFPGKVFTTDVHYKLPNYYVPQILSEMVVLSVNRLYFLSYSKESMTIHEAAFDSETWDAIYNEIREVTANQPFIPKKLSLNIGTLRKKSVITVKQRCHLSLK